MKGPDGYVSGPPLEHEAWIKEQARLQSEEAKANAPKSHAKKADDDHAVAPKGARSH